MHPFHRFPPYFTKIRSNTIFPSTPRSSEWSLTFRLESLKGKDHSEFLGVDGKILLE
jgi:hypothetical protein